MRSIAAGLAFCLVACDPVTGAELEGIADVEAPPEEEEPEEEAEVEEEHQAPVPVTTARPGDAEGTSCQRAFAAVADFRAQFEAMGGGGEAPPLDRPEYLERCETLPPGAQQCMILSYAITHREECVQFQPQIDAASSSE